MATAVDAPLRSLSARSTPIVHSTLELGLRAWVSEQTGMDLAYVEQLYTFGDRDRTLAAEGLARVFVGRILGARARARGGRGALGRVARHLWLSPVGGSTCW